MAHITSKILLLAQDSIEYIKLIFKSSDELLDVPLVRRLPTELLDYLLFDKATRNRLKLCILDARGLLEFCLRLRLGRDQLWAGSERREVTTDGAGFEQLKPAVLLLEVDVDGERGREHASGHRNITSDRARRKGKDRKVTHGYIWHLAERLVLEVCRPFVLARCEIDGNELIGDVALFGYEGHATRAS